MRLFQFSQLLLPLYALRIIELLEFEGNATHFCLQKTVISVCSDTIQAGGADESSWHLIGRCLHS